MHIRPLTANTFRSDGGAMFGLVPKTLWQSLSPALPDNTIPQRANVLLVEDDNGEIGLVDTGCGKPEWFSEKERTLHGLEKDWRLEAAFDSLGIKAWDVRWVALSHAHWDHAGGLAAPNGEPVFPNARIHIRKTEHAAALGGDPLLYKSYPANISRNLKGLQQQIIPAEDDLHEIAPGIHMLPASGHTEGQACVRFERPTLHGVDTPYPEALYAGDNCPTRHHLRMVFQTAYDTFPLETRAWKREWWPRCANKTLLLFSHDPDAYGAIITPHPRREYLPTLLYTGTEP